MKQDIGASVVADVSDLLSYLNKHGQGTAVRVRRLGEQPYSLSMTYLLPEIGARLSLKRNKDNDLILEDRPNQLQP